ncbi:MAG: ankyrin repeat domain-containing protein [Gemmatimonadota bacterium]|nr:ankyrin repeat domain-containing protein [Gemmatimonadota bacterium]
MQTNTKRAATLKLLGIMAVTAVLSASVPPDAPIADAAQRGDLETVRSLVRSGADVNAAQGDGMTALHWAADRGNAELANLLIYAGANVEAGTRIGRYTPLHIAAREARPGVVQALLEAGADPEARSTNSGATPLHLASASGDPEIVSALVEAGVDPNVTEGAWGQTPLIFAAANNRVDAIRVLIEAGADPNMSARSVDVKEWADADQAAAERLTEALDEFKEQEDGGPDWKPSSAQVQAAVELSREVQRKWPNVPQEDEGEDAADESESDADDAEGEEGEEEERKLSYAEQVDRWGGLTPLLHAVRQGHKEAAKALLESGADINQTSGDLTSPLLMATLNGQWDLAKVLLEGGADPNQASVAGATPLYTVLERQWEPKASYAHPVEHRQQETTHIEMLRELLEAGADPNARLNRHLWYMEYTFSVLGGSGIYVKGATPFWRAAYALDVEAMRLLKEHGADPGIPTMKEPERRRRAPDDPPEEEGEEAEEEPELDPSGLPPVPTNGPAIYPIHAASGVGYGQSFAGNAHRYVPDGWLDAVKFLVEEAGADVNRRDANGYTALHHAASRGDNEMIRYLVEQGADVTVVSREGQTTADMANGPVQRVQPYPATIQLLEELGSENNNNCLSC